MFVVYDLEVSYEPSDTSVTIYGVYEDEDAAEKEAEWLGCKVWEADYYPNTNKQKEK